MEGKTVIFSVLVMGLVIWQIQVDAQEQRTCCPSQSSREEFEDCISQGNLHTVCVAGSGCLESYVGFCPSQYPYGSLTNSGKNWTHLVICFVRGWIKITFFDVTCMYFDFLTQGDVVSVYCKLGCVSSLCGALTSLQKSGKNSPSALLLHCY